MNETFEKLKSYLDRGMAFQTALNLFQWDIETLAPSSAENNTAKVIGILSDEYFNVYINQDVKTMLEKLEEEKENSELTLEEKAIIRELRRIYNELESIPPKEYREFSELVATGSNVWARAKEQNCYGDFQDVLERIINYKKKFAKYRAKKEEDSYDILLKDYEPGFAVKELDSFFDLLKTELVPFIKEVVKKNDTIDKSYHSRTFDVEKQKEFCVWLIGYLGFDFDKGVTGESEHPFTTNLHNHDVRITDHFYENNLESGIFSAIHECGHAIYEMNISDQITQTLIGTGTSMGMHESQSRFFENIIGRSKEFWEPIYPKLVECFPEQLNDISLDHFIKGSNKVEPGLIRTEADELTYSLHILIRYEIEKMIFQEKISIEELPEIWKQKYKEYLGVEVKGDAEGILQDVHWSGGDFGYFPSYAIGTAISAQLYYHMKSVMPFEEYLKNGNIATIVKYLEEHIHKYGMLKNVNQILKDMTGEDFSPKYYIQYLKEKYTAIYEL